MEKVRTISVDLYEPSKNEKTIYVIDKDNPEEGIITYYYNTVNKYKVYLNLYNQLESAICYVNRSLQTYNEKCIFIKDGKIQLEDDYYYITFDRMDAEEKLLEYKKSIIEKRKKISEEHYKTVYEEIKEKYSDKE